MRRFFAAAQAAGATEAPRWPRFSLALAVYGLFGVGYIGYMTFIVALLRNAGMSAAVVTGFYLLARRRDCGFRAVWSGLLDRMRGGQALAVLNALLAVATLSARAVHAAVGGVRLGRAVRRDVPSQPSRRPQLSCATTWPAESLGQGHQRIHDRVRVRTDRRADGDRLGLGWRGSRTRPGVFRRAACGGCGAGRVPAASANIDLTRCNECRKCEHVGDCTRCLHYTCTEGMLFMQRNANIERLCRMPAIL